MRKVWTLVAVFVLLAALIGGYLLLANRPKDKSPEVTSIEIVSLDKQKLSKIVLNRSGSVLTAVKKGEEWSVDNPFPITVDQVRADDLASAVTSLAAKSVVEEDAKDLSQYGLDPPQATAKAFFTDGTEKTFHLGNKTPTSDTYYFQVAGDPKVYTVWSYINDRYRYTVSDFRDMALSPSINPDEITYLRVRQRDGTVIEMKEKTTMESQTTYLGFGTFLMTRPYAYPVGADAEKSESFLKAPANIAIGGFVEDAPKDLSRYGLDKPWGELLVRDKTNTLHLQFGSDKDADNLFFKIVGRPNVYTLEKSVISFIDTKPFELVDRFAFIPNIEHVDRIDISSRGKSHLITLTRTAKEDETITTYTVDGKIVLEGDFKTFYQELIGLITEGEIGKTAVGTPELTVRYYLNTGDLKQVTVAFIPYNKVFYAISLNGKQSFAISKSQVAAMLSVMDRLLAGEKLKKD